jgi:hypothetical protein
MKRFAIFMTAIAAVMTLAITKNHADKNTNLASSARRKRRRRREQGPPQRQAGAVCGGHLPLTGRLRWREEREGP